jgi:hypothetical protein
VGFRFHKSFSIIPGVRLNVSKTGFSGTVGVPGAHLNVPITGHRKPIVTVGLPGTGLSYRETVSGSFSWLKIFIWLGIVVALAIAFII